MFLLLLYLLSFAPSHFNGADRAAIAPRTVARPALRADEGCGMDPNGRCTAHITSDEGNGLDPHGKP